MDLTSPGGSNELVEVLMTVGRLRRTGILTVQNREQIIGLTFLEGEIVSADALNESLEEGLGRVLAGRDLVSVEDFSSLVAEYEAGGGRVTDLLVERNYLDRVQLAEALASHNYLLCREVLGWQEIEYKFYPGSEVAHEEGIRSLSVEELVVRAVDELSAVGPLQGPMPGLEVVYEQGEGEIGGGPGDDLLFGLMTGESDESTSLLSQIDGHRSVGQIAADAAVSEYEARLTFYLLERAGSVRPVVEVVEELRPAKSSETAARVAQAGAALAEVGNRWLGRGGAKSEREQPVRSTEIDWLAWPARILGLVAFVLLVVLALTDPGRYLLPFPWHESLRDAVVDEQTSAAYLKIDRAAKTAFLLDGHFPAALDELVTDLYLTPRDLVDPVGRRLGYASQVAGYLIYLEDEGEAAPGTSRTETITANFLLDPEFVPERRVEIAPLVLLD